MSNVTKIIKKMKESPQNVRFSELATVCEHFFGEPRQKSTSHVVYRTPWQGDPRINVQNANGMAKVYQVQQVLAAVKILQEKQQ